ncbi:hypothetical protein WMY93_017039 [Mugilogobius chulae]|uniref:Alpha/beta hydrolase fold-3 domain-containing protein n=1 Tax=Mugilogobius chulae TaxID=88201 RepID=A0AAW0NS01_9GOBI
MLMDANSRGVIRVCVWLQWLGFGHYVHLLRKLSDLRRGSPGQTFSLELHAKKGIYDKVARVWADELNAVVVSVEYGLYPEVQFPEPYLDCLNAAKHFLSAEVLSKYSVDPGRVAVSGDSAGGNLAAAVAQEISQDSSVRVKFSAQALIYPALQALDFNTPSDIQNRVAPILPLRGLVGYWMLYLGSSIQLDTAPLAKHKKNYKPLIADRGLEGILEKVPALLDVRASPLLADSEVLSKCPKAYIMTCEIDVLRDDGLMYAQRLQDAGVQVTSVHYENGFHGCFTIEVKMQFEVNKRAQRDYINWLRDNL